MGTSGVKPCAYQTGRSAAIERQYTAAVVFTPNVRWKCCRAWIKDDPYKYLDLRRRRRMTPNRPIILPNGWFAEKHAYAPFTKPG
jgi:hypothetical protein